MSKSHTSRWYRQYCFTIISHARYTFVAGMLIYFLYGIHYSKEAAGPNSYSILMATSEAGRGAKWGATLRVNQKSDKVPILNEEDFVH